MATITTEAWVLYQGAADDAPGVPGTFKLEEYSFPELADDEVLVEPIYGCWEGNMTHALTRSPVDICRARREQKIVLGNAGTVRVVQTGRAVKSLKDGDVALVVPIATTDRFGYLTKVMAYDAPRTMGLLAKRTKMREYQLAVIPDLRRFSIRQWSGFSLRYVAAWANWQVAYGCWRLQMPHHLMPTAHVFTWGGGVGLAEVTLAKFFGCRTLMAASTDARLKTIESAGVSPIDRRDFLNLDFDETKFENDRVYRREYLANESAFTGAIRSMTEGLGASIVIDNIGRPVFRASLRALARQGVLTTLGWKCGVETRMARANECVSRHIHVMTHGGSLSEATAATQFAAETGWLPSDVDEIYNWEDIGKLSCDFETGRVKSYFPLYQVNPC